MKNNIIVSALLFSFCAVSVNNAVAADSVQAQIDKLNADVHTVHMNTLTKYSESWGLEDRANISALKVDQARQDAQVKEYASQGVAAYNELKNADASLNKRVDNGLILQSEKDSQQDMHINLVQEAAQTANVKSDALAVRADSVEKNLSVTDSRSINNSVRLDVNEQAVRDTNSQADYDRQQQINEDKAVNHRVDKEETARSNADDSITAGLSNESLTRATQVSQLAAGVEQSQVTGDYAVSRADTAFANAQANSQSIRNTNTRVAEHSSQIANHEARIQELERNTSRSFANLDRRINKVKKSANAGTSSALSSSAIPQVTEYQRFAVGAGVGGYDGEQAVAVGFSSRVSTNIVIKASVTRDTDHGTGWNLGTSIGW